MRRARARRTAGGVPTAAVRCAGLFTRRFGPPPAPGAVVVVMVHGLGLSGRYFTPLARRLAAAGTTVMVPDLPGNARSRAAARRMPDTMETVAAFERWYRAAGLGSCLLVANSVGCQVAVAFAARRPAPVRGMVLIGPALDPAAPSVWRQFGRLLADAPREPLSLLVLAAADYLVTGPVRFAAAFRHASRYAAGPFAEHLARVRAPTLVVRGERDTVAPEAWARRAAAIPVLAETRVVAGAAHAVHYSAPDAVAELVGEFGAASAEGGWGSTPTTEETSV